VTAHHAVLITNVVDTESAPGADSVPKATENEPAIIRELWQTLTTLSERSVVEAYHDAAYRLSEAQGMFSHGVLTLAQRARARTDLFRHLLEGARAVAAGKPHAPRDPRRTERKNWRTVFLQFLAVPVHADHWPSTRSSRWCRSTASTSRLRAAA